MDRGQGDHEPQRARADGRRRARAGGCLLIDIATYATEGRVDDQAPACDAAYGALLAGLARVLRGLRDPDCTPYLGPVIPGATMTFGARVPGTSYVLDPVQAAFNVGLLIGSSDASEPAFCMDGACFADTLGAVLAVADYLSRKSVPDASPAVTVHDLLRVSIKAREIQRCLARAGDFDHASCVMIAAAAVSAAMLGASSAHVAAALALAGQRARPRDAASGAQQRWVAGEAVGQGVRLALLALAGSHAGHIVAPAAGLEVAGVPGEDSPCVAPPEQVREAGAQALRELETAVAAHFSPAQAGKLHAVLADRARVMALPVHEFVSLLVRN